MHTRKVYKEIKSKSWFTSHQIIEFVDGSVYSQATDVNMILSWTLSINCSIKYFYKINKLVQIVNFVNFIRNLQKKYSLFFIFL